MFKVEVPATSANLGPGFDTLGLALDLLLEVEVKRTSDNISVHYYNDGAKPVNVDPQKNLIVKAMLKVFKHAEIINPTFSLSVRNNIPMSRGLGSSAAAIVAGIFAANHLIEDKFPKDTLLKWAVEMEGHADNIVPAIVGGLTTAMIYKNDVYYQKVSVPSEFKAVVAVPDFTLPTKKSRSVLPEKVALQDTVYNLQRACYLLASLHNGDFRHINLAMDDMIYQPLRKQFIPGFDDVIKAAYDNGALGVAMSGAGPSIIAFTVSNSVGIGQGMCNAFKSRGIDCSVYNLSPNKNGVNIIDL
ncbi:MAG: homoserine kinase [Syntrophomonadaceae bacterium]|nr:homoserine kinase [Syntrophomonadaceae bacterium]